MKKVLGIQSNPRGHWVGDGFPVRSLFSYSTHAKQLSPFLLLDYAGPAEFGPSSKPRGVGQHPHRGFETVTIVYKGEVSHRDSTGQGGTIGPGDVQWMTAGSGILHEEFHSEAFSRSGGTLEMVQLWVNLPAKDKMTAPGYQAIVNANIPQVPLADESGQIRVIAGQYGDAPDRLILSGLGACTAITLKMVAARKQWPLTGIQVQVQLNPRGKPDNGSDIVRQIHLEGPLTEDQRAQLLRTANVCPMHKLLVGEVRIQTDLTE